MVLNAAGGKLIEHGGPLLAKGFRKLTGRALAERVEETQAAWPDAMRKLEEGEAEIVAGAVYYPDLGDIDMRWGVAGGPAGTFAAGMVSRTSSQSTGRKAFCRISPPVLLRCGLPGFIPAIETE